MPPEVTLRIFPLAGCRSAAAWGAPWLVSLPWTYATSDQVLRTHTGLTCEGIDNPRIGLLCI